MTLIPVFQRQQRNILAGLSADSQIPLLGYLLIPRFLCYIPQSPSWILPGGIPRGNSPAFASGDREKTKYIQRNIVGRLALCTERLCLSRVLADSYCSRGNLFRQLQAHGKGSQAGS